jgi:glycine dehydrogenase
LFSDINQVIAIFAEALGKEAFEVSEYVLKTIIRCF